MKKILGLFAMVLGLALVPGGASAQQKSIKDQIVGTWTLLLSDSVKADGTHVPGYGPNPMGTAMFSPNGHYSLQIYRVGRPAFKSNSRATGTNDENKAAVLGMISHFGTYAVDESDKSLTLRIEASSYPNWDATKQKRPITCITDEVLCWTTPVASAGDKAEIIWKRAK